MKPKPDQHAVPTHHQVALRILVAERAIAQHRLKAELFARQGAINEYLTQILDEAGLDNKLFGIDPTLSKFIMVQVPTSTVEPGDKPVANVAEAKALSGRDNMKVPEVSE